MTPEISYSYKITEVWGICQNHPEAVVAVAVAVTISVSLHFVFKVVLLFKNKHDKRD